MIVYPVNNDKVIAGSRKVLKGMGMSVKDAKGRVILNVMRYYFGDNKENREKAIAFTRQLVDIINKRGGEPPRTELGTDA